MSAGAGKMWGELGSQALLTGSSSQLWAGVLEVQHCPSLPGDDTALLDLYCIPSKTTHSERESHRLKDTAIDQ